MRNIVVRLLPLVLVIPLLLLALGDSGTAPCTRSVSAGAAHNVTLVQANLPSKRRYADLGSAGIRRIVATRPDFVTLNEQSRRTLRSLTAQAPGYDGYRDPRPDPLDAGRGARENVVLWNATTWRKVAAGRTRLITRAMENGVVRSRYATWVVLRSRTDPGRQVVVVATHFPVNPEGVGGRGGVIGLRGFSYDQGMDALMALVDRLDRYGPVLTGGDFNNRPFQRDPWAAVPHMAAGGYAHQVSPASGIDYVFYPRQARVVAHRDLPSAGTSDHRFFNLTRLDLGDTRPGASVPPQSDGGDDPAGDRPECDRTRGGPQADLVAVLEEGAPT